MHSERDFEPFSSPCQLHRDGLLFRLGSQPMVPPLWGLVAALASLGQQRATFEELELRPNREVRKGYLSRRIHITPAALSRLVSWFLASRMIVPRSIGSFGNLGLIHTLCPV